MESWSLPKRMGPIMAYVIVAGFSVASIGMSNVTLSYLSYPVQQVFKSCKLLPVMVGGKLIMKRVYSWGEIISALLLTVGLIVLASGKINKAQEDQLNITLFGLFLISCALIADGGFGNVQERVMHDYKVSEDELVFYSNLIGCIILLSITYLVGELGAGFIYCYEQPYAYVWMGIILSTSYIGIRFVLGVMKIHGSFVAMTVTSCRKVVSITLSFILFPKPLTLHFLVASFLVFLGLSLHIYVKNSQEINKCFSVSPEKELQDIERGTLN